MSLLHMEGYVEIILHVFTAALQQDYFQFNFYLFSLQ